MPPPTANKGQIEPRNDTNPVPTVPILVANPDNPPARPLIPAESVPLNPEEAAPLAMASLIVSSPNSPNNCENISEKISSEIIVFPLS